MAKKYRQIAVQYAEDVISGKIIAGKEVVAACRRFLSDLERDDLELRMHDPDLAINIMEKTLVHKQGETLDGEPLLGKAFILEPFQIFIVVNILGFYYKGTKIRRFKEAFIMLGRKNGKTSLIAGLAWAVGIIQRKSGSVIYLVANALKQTLQAFHFLTFSLEYKKIAPMFQIKDNAIEHSIKYEFRKEDGTPDLTINVRRITDGLLVRGLRQDDSFQDFEGYLTVYPGEYFSPLDPLTRKVRKTENTVSVHHYMASWEPQTPVLLFRKLVMRTFGVAAYDKIRAFKLKLFPKPWK